MTKLTKRQRAVLRIRLRGLVGFVALCLMLYFFRYAELLALLVFFAPLVGACLFSKPENFIIPEEELK